jgi:hypothetical protein
MLGILSDNEAKECLDIGSTTELTGDETEIPKGHCRCPTN